ncbi:members only [Carabus blaptoides fortunei]
MAYRDRENRDFDTFADENILCPACEFHSVPPLTTSHKNGVMPRNGLPIIAPTLLPTNPPVFNPELLVANDCCELLAVAGPLGVFVMELPRRGPPHGAFNGGKEIVYCRNYSLDERLFAHSKLVEVRQVRWHPGSKNDNHLLVLTCDNMFRLYKIDGGSANLVKVYQIGTQPIAVLPGTRLPFLAGLGETGVDFDFALPHIPEKEVEEKRESLGNWDNLEWPIYILRGDGEIFTLIIDVNDKKSPILKGPLSMYPASDDNYGADSCAIMCFKTTPPILAVTTSTGTIFHSIVLASTDDSELGEKKEKFPNYTIYPTNKVVFVFERIELELGLAMTDSSSSYSCPIFIHQDESIKSRYFCTHETGVHIINVPIINELDKFLEVSNDDINICLSNFNNNKSVAEYLLCTHATSTSKVNPVQGFAVFHSPSTMITLLASGLVVTLPLVTNILIESTEEFDILNNENFRSPLKNMLNEPFDIYIKKWLRADVNQPILKLSEDSEPSAKDCYEILSRATQIFRDEHFKKYDKIREEIEKRIRALQMLKKYQSNEIQRINVLKQSMQENAERLAEKYEDIKDKQEELTKRCEQLLILVTQKQPKPSESEKDMYKELKGAQKKITLYAKAIDQIKSKQIYQEIQMKNWHNQDKKKETSLGSSQTKVIKANLKDMTKQITEMIEEVRFFKQNLALK